MKFKIGDRVKCKPGYVNNDNGSTRKAEGTAGGHGYELNKIFVITEAYDYKEGIVYIVKEYKTDKPQGSGIWGWALELYEPTKWEGSQIKFNFV